MQIKDLYYTIDNQLNGIKIAKSLFIMQKNMKIPSNFFQEMCKIHIRKLLHVPKRQKINKQNNTLVSNLINLFKISTKL